MNHGIALALVALAACDGGLPEGVELPTYDEDLVAVGLYEEKCSITAIDVGGDDDDPAYALTAGHCTGFSALLHPWVINYEKFSLGVAHFGVFVDTRATPIDVTLAERLHGSMIGTDLGLYRLDATNGELRALGVTPRRLADGPPAPGDPITIASFPGPSEDDPDRVLHLSRCDLDDDATLSEDGMVFFDFHRNWCNSIRHGSSGGAALDADGRVFGVLSTQAEELLDLYTPCEMDHPCEIETGSIVYPQGAVYLSPIRALGACFTDGVFDLEHPGCSLTRPGTIPVLATNEAGYTHYWDDDLPTPTWTVDLVDAGMPYYRYKTGLAVDVHCDEDDGYGPPTAIAARPRIDDVIPEGPIGQPYLMCLQALHGDAPEPAERFLDRTTILRVTIPD